MGRGDLWAVSLVGLALMIVCDGCASETSPADVRVIVADGVQARYCPECAVAYAQWLGACLMEERRLNALLSAFITASRASVPLRFVPQDLGEELRRRREAAPPTKEIVLG